MLRLIVAFGIGNISNATSQCSEIKLNNLVVANNVTLLLLVSQQSDDSYTLARLDDVIL